MSGAGVIPAESCPAARESAAGLRVAAASVSKLEAAESDAARGSLLAGIREVAEYAAEVLVACGGQDRRRLLRQAHILRAAAGQVLNDAEALVARGEGGGSMVHTLAQLARRAGISEGRGRALYAGKKLPHPDSRDADGRPLWLGSTIDAWCERTGRPGCLDGARQGAG